MKPLLLAAFLFNIPFIAFSQTRTSGAQIRIGTRVSTSPSDTVTAADCGRLVSYSNAAAIAVTLPDAPSLPAGCWMDMQNTGAGTMTLSVNGTSTIDGQSTISLVTNQGVRLVTTGVTYLSERGQGQGQGQSSGGGITYNAGPSGAITVDNVAHTVDFSTGAICLATLACAPTGAFDLSGATITKPAKNATADPATCSVSEKYFNTTTGKFRNCLTPNTWTDENSGGGSGSGSGGTSSTSSLTARDNLVNRFNNLDWVPFDPTTAWGRDEFCGGTNYTIGVATYGELGWTAHYDVDTGTASYIAGEANHPCILRLTTNPSGLYEDAMLGLYSIDNAAQFPPPNTGSYQYDFIFRLNQTTGNQYLYLGLTGEALGSQFSDINDIYLRYITSESTHWRLRSCAASVCTTTDTGLAADANWHRLNVTAVSGVVTICMDDCSSPTAVPAAPSLSTHPLMLVGNLNMAGSRSVDLDLFSYSFRGLSRY